MLNLIGKKNLKDISSTVEFSNLIKNKFDILIEEEGKEFFRERGTKYGSKTLPGYSSNSPSRLDQRFIVIFTIFAHFTLLAFL